MAPKTNAGKQEIKATAPAKKVQAKKAVVAKKAPAAVAVKKVARVSQRKSYTRPQFRRPHTYRTPAKASKGTNTTKALLTNVDEFRVIRYPLVSDLAMKKIEENNTLTFIVDARANKQQIKHAVRALYQVKTVKVNTLIRPDGLKKAYVRLAAKHDALDIANKIGIV
jgi:large subunit ribosomal protein L23Ae